MNQNNSQNAYLKMLQTKSPVTAPVLTGGNNAVPSNPASTSPVAPNSPIKSPAGQSYVNTLKAPGSPEAAKLQQGEDMKTYFPTTVGNTNGMSKVGAGNTTGGSSDGSTTEKKASTPLSEYLKQYKVQQDKVAETMKPSAEVSKTALDLADVNSQIEKKKLSARRDIDATLDRSGGLKEGAQEDAQVISRRRNSELADLAVQQNAYANTLSALKGDRDSQNEYAKFLLDSGKAITVGDSLVDPTTGAVIYEKPKAGFELGQGQTRYEYDAGTKSYKDVAHIAPNTGLTPASVNTTINSIAGSFDNEPIVKNFNVLAEGKAFADSLPNSTTNPVHDQGLIYALAKALDPGSVVHEGEYATAQKYAQSWIKAFGSGVEQALAGTGFLSEEARKNIKDTINSRYEASLQNYQNVRKEYQRQIDDARTGKARTITDYSAAYPKTEGQTVTAPDGTQVIIVD